jgi:hypothetical protein
MLKSLNFLFLFHANDDLDTVMCVHHSACIDGLTVTTLNYYLLTYLLIYVLNFFTNEKRTENVNQ